MAKYLIDDLKIEAFRGIKNLHLEKCGRINILVGPNNCGKTSVLEAINLYTHCNKGMEWPHTGQREESSESLPLIDLVSWMFPNKNENEIVSINLKGSFPISKLTAKHEFSEFFLDSTKKGDKKRNTLVISQEYTKDNENNTINYRFYPEDIGGVEGWGSLETGDIKKIKNLPKVHFFRTWYIFNRSAGGHWSLVGKNDDGKIKEGVISGLNRVDDGMKDFIIF